MADQHDGRLDRFQLGFQPLDGRQVEVVGGLVEQQNVGFRGHHAGQRDTARFTSRQPLRVLGSGQTHSLNE